MKVYNIECFEVTLKDKINLITKILKSKGFSIDLTLKELLEDDE